MKKNKVTTAVVIGISAVDGISTQTVPVNADVTFIYSNYSFNMVPPFAYFNDETSIEHIAIKVRFTEDQNTKEVLDFNYYSSSLEDIPVTFVSNQTHVITALNFDDDVGWSYAKGDYFLNICDENTNLFAVYKQNRVMPSIYKACPISLYKNQILNSESNSMLNDSNASHFPIEKDVVASFPTKKSHVNQSFIN